MNFYEVLGVDPEADAAAIRDAYRDLAQRYHPDVNDHPDASDQFRALTRARDVLTDADERNAYDRLGHADYVDKRLAGDFEMPDMVPATTDGTSFEGSVPASSGGGAATGDAEASTGTTSSSTGTSTGSTSGASTAPGDARSSTGDRSGASAASGSSSSTGGTSGDSGTDGRAKSTAGTGSGGHSTGGPSGPGDAGTPDGSAGTREHQGTSPGEAPGDSPGEEPGDSPGGDSGDTHGTTSTPPTPGASGERSQRGSGGPDRLRQDPASRSGGWGAVDQGSLRRHLTASTRWVGVIAASVVYAAGLAGYLGAYADGLGALAAALTSPDAAVVAGAFRDARYGVPDPLTYAGAPGPVAGVPPLAAVAVLLGGAALPLAVAVAVGELRARTTWRPTWMYGVGALAPPIAVALSADAVRDAIGVSRVPLLVDLALLVAFPALVVTAFLLNRLVLVWPLGLLSEYRQS